MSLPYLRIALTDEGVLTHVHVLNVGQAPALKVRMLVHHNGVAWLSQIEGMMPRTIAAGETAHLRIHHDGPLRCVRVLIAYSANDGRRAEWAGWTFLGTPIIPGPRLLSADGHRSEEQHVRITLKGLDHDRRAYIVNSSRRWLRDVTIRVFDGETDASGILKGQYPQRWEPEEGFTVKLVYDGPERSLQLVVRWVDSQGRDRARVHPFILGRPLKHHADPIVHAQVQELKI